MKFEKHAIWKKGSYAGGGDDSFEPVMDAYILDGGEPRPAVLILPGGGYGSTSPREAEPIALKFAAANMHAFVLHYSCAPRRHPQPLHDAGRAMCLIREKASAWNVDPERIAVCGFSAGGHLAASLGVHWNKSFATSASDITREKNRPNAIILSYPVISSGKYAHRGSFSNLLGAEADDALLHLMSLEHHTSDQMPPVFLWHTAEDAAVPVQNSLLFANALATVGVPFELHVYPSGQHGLSLADKETNDADNVNPHVATWFPLCLEWLRTIFAG